MDILDTKDYSLEKHRGYRYVPVVSENFIKFGRTILYKNKNAPTITNFFDKILISSKREPNLNETDRGKKFYNKIFQIILNSNNIKHHSRNTSIGAFLAERLAVLVEMFLNDQFLKKGGSNWIHISPTIIRQFNKLIIEFILLLN